MKIDIHQGGSWTCELSLPRFDIPRLPTKKDRPAGETTVHLVTVGVAMESVKNLASEYEPRGSQV
jgi:hypothetical protein